MSAHDHLSSRQQPPDGSFEFELNVTSVRVTGVKVRMKHVKAIGWRIAVENLHHKFPACILLASVSVILLFGYPAKTVADQVNDAAVKAPLDGMSFTGGVGPDGQPKDVEDRFVFANGTFVSKECELRCEYPARPYFVRKVDDNVEFVSETKCPYKDATIVWRGTVKGDTIEGVATWTINRWYWTIKKRYEFSGKLEQSTLPVASAN